MRFVAAMLAAAALTSIVLLPGCASPGYYWQAAAGQIELWQLARPVEEIGAEPPLAERLALVERIRDFASRELALPENASYRSYADLKRPFVVWNVFAAEEFSVSPRQWCFPIAGCVSYRGYFDSSRARDYADDLRSRGYEVHVTGVPAYSTLGWFDDPVLNTFIHYPETELARLIFHELSHQLVYVPDDSEFNESFATAVELAGIERWLARHGDSAKRAAFAQAQRRRNDFTGLVLEFRERLDRLYGSDLAPSRKREAKAEALAELDRRYRALRDGPWGGYAGYDRWFGQQINNATLASVGIYNRLQPAFSRLLEEAGNDLPAFYARVKELADLPAAERRAVLEHAAERASAGTR